MLDLFGTFMGNRRRVVVGAEGDLLSNLYGKYYDLVARGLVYHAATAAAGVAPGTSIGTTAAFALENPAGSNKNLIVLSGRAGYVSGTLGAGVIHWVAQNNPSGAATTGTAITPVNAKLDGPKGVGRPFTTATVPASPAVTRVFGSLQASLASTAVAPWLLEDLVDGAIVVTPGCSIQLQGTTAAGATPLVVYSVAYAEVPVI